MVATARVRQSFLTCVSVELAELFRRHGIGIDPTAPESALIETVERIPFS